MTVQQSGNQQQGNQQFNKDRDQQKGRPNDMNRKSGQAASVENRSDNESKSKGRQSDGGQENA